MISTAEIQQNRLRIGQRIDEAAARSGRSADQVRIMAVTKTMPEGMIQMAWDAGLTLFGENRVQEAAEKYANWLDRVELHLIGHLQRNKAKLAAQTFSWVHSIDKWETACELDRRAASGEVEIRVLVEVNTSGEESKYGVKSEEGLWTLMDRIAETENLIPKGLMTVGPLTDDMSRARSAFAELHRLYESAVTRYPSLPIDTLSMGMSGDFEIAVEEGSSLVRIGTALLGSR